MYSRQSGGVTTKLQNTNSSRHTIDFVAFFQEGNLAMLQKTGKKVIYGAVAIMLLLGALTLGFTSGWAQTSNESAPNVQTTSSAVYLPLVRGQATTGGTTPTATATVPTPTPTVTPTATPAPAQPMKPDLRLMVQIGMAGQNDSVQQGSGMINATTANGGGWTVFSAGHVLCHPQDHSEDCSKSVVKKIQVFDRLNNRYMDFSHESNTGFLCYQEDPSQPDPMVDYDVAAFHLKPLVGPAPSAQTRFVYSDWFTKGITTTMRPEIPRYDGVDDIWEAEADTAWDSDGDGKIDRLGLSGHFSASTISCSDMPGTSGTSHNIPWPAPYNEVAVGLNSAGYKCHEPSSEPADYAHASLIPTGDYMKINCRTWSMGTTQSSAQSDFSWLTQLNIVTNP